MRMNKLNWYDFTVGYLIQAHYDVVKATLIINIDVPRTLEHPRHKEATCFEETFANVNLIFKEVRYLKNIVSANMTSDPNEDAGDTVYYMCACIRRLIERIGIWRQENSTRLWRWHKCQSFMEKRAFNVH